MKIEELLKDAFDDGWDSYALKDDSGFVKFMRHYKHEIESAKKEIIQDFMNNLIETYKPTLFNFDDQKNNKTRK